MSDSILQQSKKARKKGPIGGKIKIVVIVILLLSGGYWAYGKFASEDSSSQKQMTEKNSVVTKGDIQLAVETEGTVTVEDGVELSFSITGETIEAIYVEEGDTVKEGDKIASISTDSLDFELSNAQDSYQSALLSLADAKEGATEKEIKNSQYQLEQAETNLVQAKVSLEETKADAEDKVKDAEEAIADALEDLELINSSGDSEIIDEAYEDLYSDIETASINLKSYIYNADKILGVDDTSLNDDFEDVLGALDYSTLYASKYSYEKARDDRDELEDMIDSTSANDHEDVLKLYDQAIIAATDVKELYSDLQDLLDNTITSADLSQTALDSKKSTASSGYSSAKSVITSLENSFDAVDNAGDSYENLQEAYEDALANLEDVKEQNADDIENAEISVRNKEIALDQAQMSYDDLIAPLTTSELQSLVMKVNQAKNNLDEVQEKIDDATLVSPIDGEVGNINGKVGNLISENNSETFATIINKDTMFVKVDVEESDINSIEKGQKVYITFDAIEGLEIEGEVNYISMTASSSNSGVVTYEVRVLLNDVGETAVREGMTAFVVFVSEEVRDVLQVPVTAVTNVNGVASVKMRDGSYTEVVTGFTDGKMVEIISGLEEGEEITY